MTAACSYLGCGGGVDPIVTPDNFAGGDDGGSTPDAAGDGATGCHSNSDCSLGPNGTSTFCYSPELGGVGCVDAGVAPCTADTQCASEQVCRVSLFGPAGTNCTVPCAGDESCPATDTCTSDGHCQPRTCDQCPSYFSCASGVCTIPACSQDRECPGGYCVDGSCSAALGICEPPCV